MKVSEVIDNVGDVVGEVVEIEGCLVSNIDHVWMCDDFTEAEDIRRTLFVDLPDLFMTHLSRFGLIVGGTIAFARQAVLSGRIARECNSGHPASITHLTSVRLMTADGFIDVDLNDEGPKYVIASE